MYWWAKDGIWSSKEGSLTDADLFNLFPHEGIPGHNYTYNGYTLYAPDYTKVNNFRLVYSNGYLYATYIGLDGNYHMLVCDLHRKAWCYDSYAQQISTVFAPAQQSASSGIFNPVILLAGTTTNGGMSIEPSVFSQKDYMNDNEVPITCVLSTFEFDGGDVRSGEQWGDIYLDCIPVAKGSPINLTPLFLGNSINTTQVIPYSATRTQQPVSIGGSQTTNFLGIYLTWQDDFTQQSVATKLFVWQPSFLIKPPTINDQITDWYDAEIEGAKWFQGFILHADTFNQVKTLVIRDADTQTTHAFTPAVQHNGEQELAYSFNTPFIAHMVRIEPQGTPVVPWRMFDVRWVAEPTPEMAETWQTQGTSFGLTGYMHIKQVSPAYSSTTPVILTITSFDGQSPSPIVLPSTGGVFQKATFQLTPNKGQLYFFKATSTAPFQVYEPDFEVMVGQWGRSEAYMRWQLGGLKGDKVKV